MAYEQTDQEYASMFENTGEAMPQGKDELKEYVSSGKAWENPFFIKSIIDGTSSSQLTCNEETLRWLCSDSDYSIHGYMLEMSASLKKTLGQK